MKPIHIFKPGTHTSAGGTVIDFSEAVLRDAVAAYDPAIHQAPIVVGHPADNGPAYGWIDKLNYTDGEGIYAEPAQLEEQFSELVQAGRFKKVSASFYSPDAPTNPKPGSYYLRHLGFLGAQPPAIKGLKAIEFSEAEEGVVEFGEFDLGTTIGIFKRLREFLIDRFSREEADSVIRDWDLEDLEMWRQMEREESIQEDETAPDYNEQNPKPEEDDMELKAQLAAAQAENLRLTTEAANFSERETALKTAQDAADKADLTRSIQAIADTGKILPADVAPLAEFAAHLDADEVVEFGEAAEAKASRRAYFLAWLAKQPKRVDFSEQSAEDDDPAKAENPAQKAVRINDFMEASEARGRPLTYDAALRAVNSGADRT